MHMIDIAPAVAQILHRAERQHAPGHDAGAVSERVGFFHAVRCEDGAAAGGERREGAPHEAFGGGVETAGGFVEEEDGGVADEGDGEGEFAFGAAGELGGWRSQLWVLDVGDGGSTNIPWGMPLEYISSF